MLRNNATSGVTEQQSDVRRYPDGTKSHNFGGLVERRSESSQRSDEFRVWVANRAVGHASALSRMHMDTAEHMATFVLSLSSSCRHNPRVFDVLFCFSPTELLAAAVAFFLGCSLP